MRQTHTQREPGSVIVIAEPDDPSTNVFLFEPRFRATRRRVETNVWRWDTRRAPTARRNRKPDGATRQAATGRVLEVQPSAEQLETRSPTPPSDSSPSPHLLGHSGAGAGAPLSRWASVMPGPRSKWAKISSDAPTTPPLTTTS